MIPACQWAPGGTHLGSIPFSLQKFHISRLPSASLRKRINSSRNKFKSKEKWRIRSKFNRKIYHSNLSRFLIWKRPYLSRISLCRWHHQCVNQISRKWICHYQLSHMFNKSKPRSSHLKRNRLSKIPNRSSLLLLIRWSTLLQIKRSSKSTSARSTPIEQAKNSQNIRRGLEILTLTNL